MSDWRRELDTWFPTGFGSLIGDSIAAGQGGAVELVDPARETVSFAYAAPGDTNLDWQVDVLDVANFLSGGKFNSDSPATWFEGDFNYDGVVDVLDAAGFVSTSLYDQGSYNSPPSLSLSGLVGSVTEPAAWRARSSPWLCERTPGTPGWFSTTA